MIISGEDRRFGRSPSGLPGQTAQTVRKVSFEISVKSAAGVPPKRQPFSGQLPVDHFRGESNKNQRTGEEKRNENAPEVLERHVLEMRRLAFVIVQAGVHAILFSHQGQSASYDHLVHLLVNAALSIEQSAQENKFEFWPFGWWSLKAFKS